MEPNGINIIKESLFSEDYVTKAREEQMRQAGQLPQEHLRLKANFPTPQQGKYTKEQAGEFSNLMTVQALAGLHREFLKQFTEGDFSKLKLENFRGIRLRAMAIFYKYYLGRREPKKTSELGDFGHLYYLPYCKLAVMENDLCSILNQLKKNQEVIGETEVENLSFLRGIVEV